MTSFVDEATVELIAGDGGPGITAFRREKYVPYGGPSGGDGGKGGDIVFRATHGQNTLSNFRHQRRLKADSGKPGGSNQMTGASGESLLIEVPVGTLVIDADTDELLADLTQEGDTVVAAKGGDGGKGNARYKTSTNRAPKKCTPGFPGEHRQVRLELKLIADVALVGYPSVGKSTLISVLSNARPKIADYPFTTLVPNLGVVPWRDYKSFVIADVPGLIEGAHHGHGLGIKFLKHIERTHVICHVIEVTAALDGQPDDRDPIEDYNRIRKELRLFNPDLCDRSEIVVLNKSELPWAQERENELRDYFQNLGVPFVAVSALTQQNLNELKDLLGQIVLGGGGGGMVSSVP